jgi:hypothetical protein
MSGKRSWALRTSAIIVALVAALGSFLTGIEPAAAGAEDARMHTYNVCGHKCNGGAVPGANDLPVWFAGQSPGPWIISINELCFSQYQDLENRLEPAPKNFRGFFQTTKSTNLSFACGGAYGNAVFAIGAPAGGKPDDVPQVDVKYAAANQTSTSELRGILCNLMSTLVGSFVACSTHLTPEDDPTASRQLQEARDPHVSL